MSSPNSKMDSTNSSVKIQQNLLVGQKQNNPVTKVEEDRQTKQINLLSNNNAEENLIKRPLDIVRQNSSNNLLKQPIKFQIGEETMKYKMIPAMSGQEIQNEPRISAFNYPNPDYNDQMSFNRIFPEGWSPPILDHRKRNRRLSSIVGIRSNPYTRDWDVEELFEPTNNDRWKPDSRKTSIDLTPNDQVYYNDSRKQGMYFFAGIPHQSPIETQFTQHPIFMQYNEPKRNPRKQSTNIPLPDNPEFKPYLN